MVVRVYIRKLTDVEAIYEGEINFGVFEVQVALKVACIFHCQDYLLFREIILAEDV
jgi:hypothetical protein